VFVNWLLSRETQARLAPAVLYNSRRLDVPAVDPAKLPEVARLGDYVPYQAEKLMPELERVQDLVRATCSGLRTKQAWLANRSLFGLAIIANTAGGRPTMIANEPTMYWLLLPNPRKCKMSVGGVPSRNGKPRPRKERVSG